VSAFPNNRFWPFSLISKHVISHYLAYYEKMEKILKWDHGEVKVPEMAVNMEWGAFDNERRVIHLTPYDNKLDRESINPRFQIYEKLISGMYLGEIARNVLLHLIDRSLLFNGLSSPDLNKQWSFETAYMSTIEADSTKDLSETQHVLESILAIPVTTLVDRQIVKKICEFVGVRAARVSAAGLGAVLSHCNKVEEGCTIAIDGSVFEFYPNFADNMMGGLKELFGDQIENKVKFSLARDGSGLGAAVIAMMAHNTPKI
jgi:hexokinase